MKFWVGWALWQKLSTVFALLLSLVLIYSFYVLVRNRRKIKRHAAAEAYQKEEQDTELYPILTGASDIPFGARALERGIQVEGIWVSSSTTPSPKQPATPIGSRAASPMINPLARPAFPNSTSDIERQLLPYPLASRIGLRGSRHTSKVGNLAAGERRESLHSDILRASHDVQPDVPKNNESRNLVEPDRPRSRAWFSPRSSWITKSPEERKRQPGFFEGHHRRQSSEEFRRRISKLIDENIQTRPIEAFQLNPIRHEETASHDRSTSALSQL